MSENEKEIKSFQNKWYEFATRYPITVLMIITLLCLIFRLLDTFVLPITELVGELIFSKSLGLILIVFYLWSINRKPKAIGIHRSNLGQSFAIGFLLAAIMLGVYYILTLVVNSISGIEGGLEFAPTDPKTGLRGDYYFALWLLFGNIVNVLMEEGLFRGLMTRKFLDKMSFWRTNILQAFLFGIWHITWPIKDFIDGETSFGGFILQSIIQTLSPFLIALIWGYMFFKTASLIGPLISHYLWNSTLNVILFIATSGEDTSTAYIIAGGGAIIAGLFSIYLIKFLVERWNLPQLKPWSAGEMDLRV
ncbi:MAG: lysostaphin resistance A-like protein [Promethearchaeota archaeon]